MSFSSVFLSTSGSGILETLKNKTIQKNIWQQQGIEAGGGQSQSSCQPD